jgi:predicted Zn-dependent protease
MINAIRFASIKGGASLSIEQKSQIYYGMGMESMEQADFVTAIKHFEKSLELMKRSITAARLYECLARLNRHQEARKYIEMAFMLNTSSDVIATQYANVLIQSNETKKARIMLQNVLQRNASFQPARKLLDSLPE